MTMRAHWESVYGKKAPDEVSWYRPHLERSLAFVEGAGLAKDAAILDVGGGASTLCDDLLARGYTEVTVLDLSATAIEAARARLGPRAAGVHWVVADVTELALPPGSVAFWHDRAVFHFLREPDARRRYVAAVERALAPGGHIVVATFGPDGPERCSGLEVARYDADALHGEFGSAFRKVDSVVEVHATPWGTEQQFVYCYCRLAHEAAAPSGRARPG
ncbi:MAG: class I SAM-dependent methyltransferase [Myxococcales bacterium]|nr:class I SAM-dependent methyltransferase [Myxococcales bacterium]